jgi:hypothetical protein
MTYLVLSISILICFLDDEQHEAAKIRHAVPVQRSICFVAAARTAVVGLPPPERRGCRAPVHEQRLQLPVAGRTLPTMILFGGHLDKDSRATLGTQRQPLDAAAAENVPAGPQFRRITPQAQADRALKVRLGAVKAPVHFFYTALHENPRLVYTVKAKGKNKMNDFKVQLFVRCSIDTSAFF